MARVEADIACSEKSESTRTSGAGLSLSHAWQPLLASHMAYRASLDMKAWASGMGVPHKANMHVHR
jgi:hypothetical protein